MAEFKHIVRIANTDLKGERPVVMSLQKIKGISHVTAAAVCNVSGIPFNKKTGELTDEEEERLNKIILNLEEYLPEWMLNRQRDPETGVSKHLIGGDIKFVQENDIKIERRIKSYRGVRHAAGLPVRGQRTKSNFRPMKGKVSIKKKRTVVRK